MKKTKLKFKFSVVKVTGFIVLSLYVLILVFNLIWALFSSLKMRMDYLYAPLGWPSKFIFSNYSIAIKHFEVKILISGGDRMVGFWEMMGNSLFYALGCSFAYTLITCVTAYATSRFKFKFNSVIYAIVIVTMILPIVGSLPAEIRMVKTLGLYDSLFGMLILKANFLGLYYLIFHAMFSGIPKDFSEAAHIDGASYFRVMLTIMFPMAKNTFGTVLLLSFIGLWNDYQTPLVYLPSHPTAALGLLVFNESTVPEISSGSLKLAASFLVFFPVFTIFLVFQKRLIGNISLGGLKE